MNDQFLNRYRIAPRPAFAEAMRRRLGMDETKPQTARRVLARPAFMIPATLLLALALTLTVSPAARAQVQDWAGMIGGVFFTATGDYPGGGDPGPARTVPSDEMSLDEARAALPFPLDMPAWVPEGYVMQEKVVLYHFEDGLERVHIGWDAPGKGGLRLLIENRPPDEANWLVGPGSVEEVQVNGEPAALVRGGWYSNTKQWENQGQLNLYISHNGQTYVFFSMEDSIPVDKLVRIAESLP